jgi:hypothetical protein
MTKTNTTPANAPVVNDELGLTIRQFSKGIVDGDKRGIKLVDTLERLHWKSTDLISPKSQGSTATPEMFEWVKERVLDGFPKGVRPLLELSAKAAGDKLVDGRNRAYWNRQPNAIVGQMQRSLKNREEIAAEIASGKSGPDARTRSAEALVRSDLEQAIKRIQKAESFKSSMDVADLIQNLTALIKVIG